VVGTWPRAGSEEVLTDQLVVRFSKPVSLSSADPSTFRFTTFSGTPVPGSFDNGLRRNGDPDFRLLVFTPDSPLRASMTYRLHLTQGMTGATGRPLDEAVLVQFTTSAAKREDGFTPLGPREKAVRLPRRGPSPRVTWTFPAAGQGGVYSDEVRVRFNRPMAQESLNASSFQVLQGNRPFPGTITFDVDERSGGTVVVFVPPEELPFYPNTAYRVVVTRDARTTRDRFLPEEFLGGFRTSPFKSGIVPVQPEDFAPGPDLETGRAFHTASGLDSGDVVVAGGQSLAGVPLASTEVYRRLTNTFETVAPLAEARRKHAAVTLKDGRVLVCGGFGPSGNTVATVELFHPGDGAWLPGPPMSVSRANHTATLLASGRVLVAAGFTTDPGSLTWTLSAEVFDPLTNSWSPTTGAPLVPRGGHTANRLPDGRVLLVGGGAGGDRSAELYQPATGTFILTGGQPQEFRIFHASAVTSHGTVLVAGGGPPQAEQYDPVQDAFLPSGQNPPFGLPVTDAPSHATLTPVPGGRVILIGGLSTSGLVLDKVQVWAATGLSPTGNFYPMLFDLLVPRAAHTVTSLQNGKFLVVGGFGTSGTTNERRSTVFLPSQSQ
jgi:hypothetical protein